MAFSKFNFNPLQTLYDNGITSYTVNTESEDSEEEKQIVHHDQLEKSVDEKNGTAKKGAGHGGDSHGEESVSGVTEISV